MAPHPTLARVISNVEREVRVAGCWDALNSLWSLFWLALASGVVGCHGGRRFELLPRAEGELRFLSLGS
jgi:hypothetical protein